MAIEPESLKHLQERLVALERDLVVRGDNRNHMQEIWTALRAVQQDAAINANERRHAEERSSRIEKRINDIESLLKDKFEELNEVMVRKERYQNVERIVYGMVTVILSGFIMAVGTMVFK